MKEFIISKLKKSFTVFLTSNCRLLFLKYKKSVQQIVKRANFFNYSLMSLQELQEQKQILYRVLRLQFQKGEFNKATQCKKEIELLKKEMSTRLS